MNVLAITHMYPNRAEPGLAPYNRQQFSALARHVHLRVVAPVFWTAPSARSVARAGPERWNGIEVYHPYCVYPPRLRATHGLFYWASIAQTLARLWRQEPWDVFYGTFLFPDGYASVHAGRKYRRPCVLKAHGSDVNEVAQHPIRRRMIRRALQSTAAVVVVSRALQEGVNHLGVNPQRAHLLYNGLDLKRFFPLDRGWARRQLRLPDEERIVLYAGNLKRFKAPEIFVDALGRLIRGGRALRGLIVGDGPHRGAVEKAIQGQGLGDRIRVVGAVPHEEMPLWYAAADALCLPSLMEGVPNVIVEALACGRPVVATAVGGVPEILDGSCGALVPAGDSQALGDAIASVLDRPWSTSALAKRVAHLSWDDNGRALAGILGAAAGNH